MVLRAIYVLNASQSYISISILNLLPEFHTHLILLPVEPIHLDV